MARPKSIYRYGSAVNPKCSRKSRRHYKRKRLVLRLAQASETN